MKKNKRMSEDRKRQVETTKKRYGEDHYRVLGLKASSFKDPKLARRAALKRWHPELFDENGKLINEELLNAKG